MHGLMLGGRPRVFEKCHQPSVNLQSAFRHAGNSKSVLGPKPTGPSSVGFLHASSSVPSANGSIMPPCIAEYKL